MAVVLAALTALAVLAGCGSSTNSSTQRSNSDGSGADAGGVNVPITLFQIKDGAWRVKVRASVGGGPMVDMWLDTGSVGMFVDPKVIGTSTATSNKDSNTYEGFSLGGSVVSAAVTLGSSTSANPVELVAATDVKANWCTADACTVEDALSGLSGIIGIGASNGDSIPTMASPLLQAGGAWAQGWTFVMPTPPTGVTSYGATLELGPVGAPTNAVAIPMTPIAGTAGWQKDLQLCWTYAGSSPVCGPTDLDIGQQDVTFSVSAFTPPLPAGTQPAGRAVAVTTSGSNQLWSFTSGTTPSIDLVTVSSRLSAATMFNTGIGFFLGRSVAWDMVGHQVLVW